jgi:hypothetical protein
VAVEAVDFLRGVYISPGAGLNDSGDPKYLPRTLSGDPMPDPSVPDPLACITVTGDQISLPDDALVNASPNTDDVSLSIPAPCVCSCDMGDCTPST